MAAEPLMGWMFETTSGLDGAGRGRNQRRGGGWEGGDVQDLSVAAGVGVFYVVGVGAFLSVDLLEDSRVGVAFGGDERDVLR